MRIAYIGDGRMPVGIDAGILEPFDIIKRQQVRRCPVGITKLESVIIILYVAIRIVKMQLQLLAAVQRYHRKAVYIPCLIQLYRVDGRLYYPVSLAGMGRAK